MAERPAVNASPLIFLSRGGLLDLLQVAAPRLVVPRPVAAEITAHGSDDVTARYVRETAWLEIVEPPPVPVIIRAWDPGEGEPAVLA